MEKQTYIGERKVIGVKDSDKETPQGNKIIEVQYEDGISEFMPKLRYDSIVTEEKTDASSAQDKLLKTVASAVYGFMHEYDVKMAEIDPLLNNIVTLVNNGSIKATNQLWGVENADDRSMLMINEVLNNNYVEPIQNKNGSSSSGEGTSGENQKQK